MLELTLTETLISIATEVLTNHLPQGRGEPDAEWIRGKCPMCEQPVVINWYYVGGKGYLGVYECWASLGERPACEYRRVL